MRQFKFAAIISLRQFIVLDRGAIATVENQYLLRRARDKGFTRAHAAAFCAKTAGRLPSKWQIA